MSTAPTTFSSVLHSLRDEIGKRHLTQGEAAEQLGVSERTLQYWLGEAEIVPQAKHRRAILAWLADPERAA